VERVGVRGRRDARSRSEPDDKDIAARFLNDAEFREVLTDYLVRKVHRDLTGPAPVP
jgi:hypothetical protein